MRKGNNRQRILSESIVLFNRSGIVAMTTNHICHHLNISPGNFYFHFKSKEEVIRELFQLMCQETYATWLSRIQNEKELTPITFLEDSLEIFWKFRFFHREMYHLRRQDPELNKIWHEHMRQSREFMELAYIKWVQNGLMREVKDVKVRKVLTDITMITASSFFLFMESPDKPAVQKPLELAKEYVIFFLMPYLTPEYAATIRKG